MILNGLINKLLCILNLQKKIKKNRVKSDWQDNTNIIFLNIFWFVANESTHGHTRLRVCVCVCRGLIEQAKPGVMPGASKKRIIFFKSWNM